MLPLDGGSPLSDRHEHTFSLDRQPQVTLGRVCCDICCAENRKLGHDLVDGKIWTMSRKLSNPEPLRTGEALIWARDLQSFVQPRSIYVTSHRRLSETRLDRAYVQSMLRVATLTVNCHVGPIEGDWARQTSVSSRGIASRNLRRPIGKHLFVGFV